MRGFRLAAVAWAVACAALWLMGGFIVWDWDVRGWSEGGRFFLVMVDLCAAVLVSPIYWVPLTNGGRDG